MFQILAETKSDSFNYLDLNSCCVINKLHLSLNKLEYCSLLVDGHARKSTALVVPILKVKNPVLAFLLMSLHP